MKFFPAIFIVSVASAAITDLRVTGTTSTQAVISYTAPTTTACTVVVSQSPSLTPVVPDTDATLFPGSTSDSRLGSISDGRRRIFVAGTRGYAPVTSNGKRVSRALAAHTKHYYQITCGADTATGEFMTANIPLGNTRNDGLPVDRSAPGIFAMPDLDYQTRNAKFTDPLTGLEVKSLTFPGDVWNNPTTVTFDAAYNDGSQPCVDGAWTTPCGAVDAANPVATVGNSTAWLNIRPATMALDSANPYWPNASVSLDRIELTFTGSGASSNAAFRTMQVCLSVDGGVSCATDIKEFTFGTSEAATLVPGALPANGTFGADPWLSDAKISIPLANTYFGSASVSGSTVTLGSTFVNGDNAYFGESWTSGSRIQLGNGTTYADCVIASITKGRVLTIQNPACITDAGLTAVAINSYRAQNFVVKIRRKTANSETVSLQNVSMRLATSNFGGWPSTGGTTICSRVNVDGGYYCGMPVGSSFTALYWIESATGNAVPLGRMAVNVKTTGSAADQWGALQNATAMWDNTKTIPTFYALVTSNAGKRMIVKGELLPCPGSPCFSHAAPATGATLNNALGTGTATWGTYSITFPNGVRWTILNPASLGQDLVTQIQALVPDYDASNFNQISLSEVQQGWPTFVAHHGSADTLSYIGAFDPGDGDPTHAGQSGGPRVAAFTSTWTGEPYCRWCTRHSMLGAGDSPYAIIEANNFNTATTNTTWGAGPYIVTTNTEILTTTGSCPANSYGATDCITLTINEKTPLVYPAGDPRNLEPYDPNPASGDPYVNPGALATAKVGDMVCVSNTNGSCVITTTPWNEVMRLISKSGNQWTFQRNVTYENSSKKAITGTGLKYLYFVCTAIHPTQPAVPGGVAYWDFKNDPTGQNMKIDLYNFGSHQVFRPGFFAEQLNQCPAGVAPCYGVRTTPAPELFTTPIANKQNANPTFANASGPGGSTQKQTHITFPNTDSIAYEKQSYYDVRPPINSGTYTYTLLPGSQITYKASWATSDPHNFGPFHRKKLETEAWCGPHPLVDVSGPGSIIDDSTPYTYCIPGAAGECSDAGHTRTTAIGEVYVSCPRVSHTSCQGSNAFIYALANTDAVASGGVNVATDICVTDAPAHGDAVMQVSVNDDRFGLYSRRLSYLTGRNKLADVFSSVRTMPDGSNLMWRYYWGDLFRSEAMIAKMPPFPPSDSLLRNDFVPVALKIAPQPGATNVIAEFGYEENRGSGFSAVIPPCTSRQEGCVRAAQANNDFAFASQAVTGVSCASGCTVTIPAIPQRVLYYRLVFRDASNAVVSYGETTARPIP